MHQMREMFPDYLAPPAGNIAPLRPASPQGIFVNKSSCSRLFGLFMKTFSESAIQ